MILTENNGRDVLIVDKTTGSICSHIKSFNTETKEAEVYATICLSEKENTSKPDNKRIKCVFFDKNNKKGDLVDGCNEIVTFKCTLPYMIAVNRETLKEIK